jgi:hypothetical protein
VLEPPQSGLYNLIESAEFLLEIAAPFGCQAIRPTSIRRFKTANQAALLKPSNRSIKRARAKSDVGERLDVLHHGVAVLVAIGEAGKNE